ncbi:MipA/OmpV family protein [Marinospirillum perlucidum]|uniref:MipA/OmpV family protein n=1 Tax=Marinospirillum perlucidum TaxID=1982602 RepID=UPI00138FE847|nr:MipA/OmpV family protein [Marinospirillum perlucidum]
MSVLSKSPFLLAILGWITSCSLALAEEPGSLQVQLGLASSANTSFYQEVGKEYYLFPLVIAEYQAFYLRGTHGGYRFYEGDAGQTLGLEIRRTFDGYAGEDAKYLNGMNERKAAWEAGLAYQTPWLGGELKAQLLQDISDRHQGLSARVEFERLAWMNSSHLLTWYVGSEYWDTRKTEYYFGVETLETLPHRPSYRPEDSYTGFIGTNFFRQLTPKLTLIISGEYLLASSAIADSPLTTREDQWSAYGGIFYQF